PPRSCAYSLHDALPVSISTLFLRYVPGHRRPWVFLVMVMPLAAEPGRPHRKWQDCGRRSIQCNEKLGRHDSLRPRSAAPAPALRSEEHTSELQSRENLV